MESSTAAINDEPLFADKFDVAAPPDDWSELHSGYSPATRKWLYFRRKYLVDRVAGAVLLVLASPLIAFLILIVRSTSRGPGLYRQLRVGHRGKPFYILKIRSMVQDAEKDGKPVWCTKRDPRVTRLGAFLRKVHLDELPQLVNVARGEMALVGPRPERPEIIKDLRQAIDEYEKRLSVMPGVTGLAQINLPPRRNDRGRPPKAVPRSAIHPASQRMARRSDAPRYRAADGRHPGFSRDLVARPQADAPRTRRFAAVIADGVSSPRRCRTGNRRRAASPASEPRARPAKPDHDPADLLSSLPRRPLQVPVGRYKEPRRRSGGIPKTLTTTNPFTPPFPETSRGPMPRLRAPNKRRFTPTRRVDSTHRPPARTPGALVASLRPAVPLSFPVGRYKEPATQWRHPRNAHHHQLRSCTHHTRNGPADPMPRLRAPQTAIHPDRAPCVVINFTPNDADHPRCPCREAYDRADPLS